MADMITKKTGFQHDRISWNDSAKEIVKSKREVSNVYGGSRNTQYGSGALMMKRKQKNYCNPEGL